MNYTTYNQSAQLHNQPDKFPYPCGGFHMDMEPWRCSQMDDVVYDFPFGEVVPGWTCAHRQQTTIYPGTVF